MNSAATEFWSKRVLCDTDILLGYALMKTGCRHQAADIVQDAFLAAIRSGTQPANPRAYLMQAVRRRSAELSRSKIEVSQLVQDVADKRIADFDSRPTTWTDTLGDVWRVVAQLSPDFQEVIMMRINGEFSFAEISEIIGTPIGTVTSRYSRALTELRRKLQSGKPDERS
jgi:RNA polymerase sigma-70 factor (ECF subfamily)